jgi:hypothetical protein
MLHRRAFVRSFAAVACAAVSRVAAAADFTGILAGARLRSRCRTRQGGAAWA